MRTVRVKINDLSLQSSSFEEMYFVNSKNKYMNSVSIQKLAINFKVSVSFNDEQCTIVHCTLPHETLCRIWPDNTFLIEDNGSKKKLIHLEGVSVYPDYDFTKNFTLVFEGLSKACDSFHLVEEIPERFGFVSNEIKRNRIDVYNVSVFW